jgi:prepilin signal peptidase PulO-like enzyme (type II secretory pathway)
MAQDWIIWGFIAFVGAAIGSFLTLATYRLPRDEKIGMTRSRCPSCGTTLRVADLFPIFTWIFAGGKCRHCKTKVSARYPLTELACALGALAAAYHYGFTLHAFAITGLWWCIVAIIVTDLEHYIILDEVQVAIVVFGVLYHYAIGSDFMEVIAAGFIGLLIGLTLKYGFLYLRNKDGLGLGDVKLLFGCGIWLASGASFVPFLFFSGVLGVVFGLGWRVIGRGEVFPFGPALAAALLACVVWPAMANQFWQLYGFIGQH